MRVWVCFLSACVLHAASGITNTTRHASPLGVHNNTLPRPLPSSDSSSSPSSPSSPEATTAAGTGAEAGTGGVDGSVPIVDVSPSQNRNHSRSGDHVYPTPGSPSTPPTHTADFSLCPSACNGHGYDCVPQPNGHGAVCICLAGFDGPDCSQWVGCAELTFCNGHGSCVCRSASCHCNCSAGFHGLDCSIPYGSQCPNHCSGHGWCDVSTVEYKCNCDKGYEGVDCSRVSAVCPSSCSGQGSCDMDSTNCTCSATASGTECATAVDVCASCRHGVCDLTQPTPQCKCDSGYQGEHCDVVVVDQIPCASLAFCSGHGVCNENACQCNPGFAGVLCDKLAEASEDSCPNFCSGHGTCDVTTRKCVCSQGYTGEDCALPPCPVVASSGAMCSGHGVCASSPTDSNAFACSCDPCFSGEDCSINAAELCPNLCNGHGSCVCNPEVSMTHSGNKSVTAGPRCKCEEGWEGPECQFPSANENCCPLNCSGNGACDRCSCGCFDGWEGEDCATQHSEVVPPSSSSQEGDALDVLQDLLQTAEAVQVQEKDQVVRATRSMARLWD